MTVYTVTTLHDPSANSSTSANGLNNVGHIVGSYSVIGVSPITHQGYGFIYNRQDGTYTTLDDPLAVHGGVVPGTSAQGINDVGQVVGFYTGFFSDVGTPPLGLSGSSTAAAPTPPSTCPARRRPMPTASTTRAKSPGITPPAAAPAA